MEAGQPALLPNPAADAELLYARFRLPKVSRLRLPPAWLAVVTGSLLDVLQTSFCHSSTLRPIDVAHGMEMWDVAEIRTFLGHRIAFCI